MSNSSSAEAVTTKLERTPEKYFEERLQFKINAYTEKGRNYRRSYRFMASFAAIGSLVVPVLINLNPQDEVVSYAPTVLSLMVASVVALETIWRPLEHWRNYDLISSFLREEEMRFSTKAAPYNRAKDKDAAFAMFVDRIEDAISKERAATIVMRTTRSGGDDREGRDRDS